jgi:hypothetical protein
MDFPYDLLMYFVGPLAFKKIKDQVLPLKSGLKGTVA